MKNFKKELHFSNNKKYLDNKTFNRLFVKIESKYDGFTLSEVEEKLGNYSLRQDLEKDWSEKLSTLFQSETFQNKLHCKCFIEKVSFSLKPPFVSKTLFNIFNKLYPVGDTKQTINLNSQYILSRIMWGADHFFVWSPDISDNINNLEGLEKQKYLLVFAWESPGILITPELDTLLSPFWKNAFPDYSIIKHT